jgi:hypothetical protein
MQLCRRTHEFLALDRGAQAQQFNSQKTIATI